MHHLRFGREAEDGRGFFAPAGGDPLLSSRKNTSHKCWGFAPHARTPDRSGGPAAALLQLMAPRNCQRGILSNDAPGRPTVIHLRLLSIPATRRPAVRANIGGQRVRQHAHIIPGERCGISQGRIPPLLARCRNRHVGRSERGQDGVAQRSAKTQTYLMPRCPRSSLPSPAIWRTSGEISYRSGTRLISKKCLWKAAATIRRRDLAQCWGWLESWQLPLQPCLTPKRDGISYRLTAFSSFRRGRACMGGAGRKAGFSSKRPCIHRWMTRISGRVHNRISDGLGPYRLNSCTKSKEISLPTVGAPVPG